MFPCIHFIFCLFSNILLITLRARTRDSTRCSLSGQLRWRHGSTCWLSYSPPDSRTLHHLHHLRWTCRSLGVVVRSRSHHTPTRQSDRPCWPHWDLRLRTLWRAALQSGVRNIWTKKYFTSAWNLFPSGGPFPPYLCRGQSSTLTIASPSASDDKKVLTKFNTFLHFIRKY